MSEQKGTKQATNGTQGAVATGRKRFSDLTPEKQEQARKLILAFGVVMGCLVLYAILRVVW